MKKQYLLPLILFAVFFLIDLGLIWFVEAEGALYLFVAAVFLEIAIFGCIIIYLINKRNDDKDEDKNDDYGGGTK